MMEQETINVSIDIATAEFLVKEIESHIKVLETIRQQCIDKLEEYENGN